MQIKFNSELNFSEDETGIFRVGGTSVTAGYIESKHFILPRKELKNIARTLKGSYLLIDHSKSVKDAIGKVDKTTVFENSVTYEATLTDSEIADKIKSGILKNSSIGLHVELLRCSICGAEYGTCYHMLGQEYESTIPEASEYLNGNICAIYGSNIRAREQSIVLFPAIQGASIKPMNFDDSTEALILKTEAEKEDRKEIADIILNKIVNDDDRFKQLQEQVNTLTESISLLIEKNNILENELSTERNRVQGQVAGETRNIISEHNDLKESIRETIFKTRRDGKKPRDGYNFRRELHRFDITEAIRELNLARN